MLYIVCIAAGLSAVLCWFSKKIRDCFYVFGYEIIYWVLGGAATTEDLLYVSCNKLKDLPKRTNEFAVITGGTRGIGYEVVRKLLECDMHVIMGCRKIKAGEDAVKSIRDKGVTSGIAHFITLDTSSMTSVKNFAKEVLQITDNIHLLINNAGIMFVPHSLTEDGFESQFCVNYLGHFLLSHLLLPTLKKTGHQSATHARIVNVSSCAHIPGTINFDDVNYKRSLYIPSKAYAQSKLAQLMFTKAVERQMRNEGTKISSFAVHPGVVDTDLFSHTPLKKMAPWLPKLIFKAPEQGAVSVVYAATSESLEGEGGAYISNCRKTWVSPYAKNEEKQDRLMHLSLDLLNIKEFGVSDMGN